MPAFPPSEQVSVDRLLFVSRLSSIPRNCCIRIGEYFPGMQRPASPKSPPEPPAPAEQGCLNPALRRSVSYSEGLEHIRNHLGRGATPDLLSRGDLDSLDRLVGGHEARVWHAMRLSLTVIKLHQYDSFIIVT